MTATFELREYQEQGVEFLLANPRALLADEMGLGKTVQVAVALGRLRANRLLRRVLVVCPASLQLNWERELHRFGPSCAVRLTQGVGEEERNWLYKLPVPIVVTSYESLRTDFLPVPPYSGFDVVVFDEAQRLKNSDAATTWAARRVESERSWLLSATPLENGLADLGSLAQVMRLMPAGNPMERDDSGIREALQGRFLRRRKQDVLAELPPMIEQEIPLRLEGSQRSEYEALLQEQDWNGSVADLLALITRLKLVCNRSSSGASVKLDALRLILEGLATEPAKLIVISQYTETLRWLSAQIGDATYLFTGDMTLRERESTLNSFRESTKTSVLLLSLKAGGVGLNIPEASHVILFDRWWTPAAEEQAVARAHRFGRQDSLLVYRFRVVDSVEDRIVEIARGKSDLFDDIVEDRLVEDADRAGWSRADLLHVLDRA